METDQGKIARHTENLFSPEGVYHQINLNILQNPENQQYIIDEMEIQQVINTKEILAYQGEKDAQNFESLAKSKASLFGRLAYDMDSLAFLANIELGKETNPNYALRDLRDLRSGKFSDLIGTEKEVRVIDSLLQTKKLPTERFLLGEATEQRLKNLRNPSILHIATHGFFIPTRPAKTP